ncbi:MAG: Fur family transcriptional regulator [Actinomycetes bacterium]
MIERFRAQGLKMTPQRAAVFGVLYDNPTHPSAESVHAAVVADMPTVSLRTVYQTLNDLAEMGEIHRLEVGTGSARFDPNVEESHHHLVCDDCGMVRDLHVDLRARVTKGLADTGDVPEGFDVLGADLIVRGRCRSCAQQV